MDKIVTISDAHEAVNGGEVPCAAMISPCRNTIAFFVTVLLLVFTTSTTLAIVVLDFEVDFGGIPNVNSSAVCQSNTDLLSRVLQHNASNNVIRINNHTFHFYGGVNATHVRNAVLVIDGTMRFERNYRNGRPTHRPPPCFLIEKSQNITLTSTNRHQRGLIDGRGSNYWGVPGIGYIILQEHRPRLVRFTLMSNLLIENIIFQDSPYHTLYLETVENVTVRHCSIVARRTPDDGHSLIDLTAFNTDGIDVSGTNVHIHDVDIWTQDDCIAVKDNHYPPYQSTNMLMERVNCSGLGFVVGSIGGSIVRNITFRNSYLHRSVKGLYLKFHRLDQIWKDRNMTGLIEFVTFENITMEEPLQWPLWVGPAQQSDSRRLCHASPCSLCWPQNPIAQCNSVPKAQIRNLTLRNIQINNPKMSPGVILGGSSESHNMIDGVLFDNVRVTKGPLLSQAEVDRMIIFPGLLQPIVDHYVPNDYERQVVKELNQDISNADLFASLLLILNILLLIAFRCCCCSAKKHIVYTPLQPPSDDDNDTDSHSDDNEDSPSTSMKPTNPLHSCYGRVMATLFVFDFVFVVSMYKVARVQPQWKLTDHYFRCSGVTNGIATGGTWPVPFCFANNSTSHPLRILTSMGLDPFVAVPSQRQLWEESALVVLRTMMIITGMAAVVVVLRIYGRLQTKALSTYGRCGPEITHSSRQS